MGNVDFLNQVRDFSREQSLFETGHHILVAVSGGIDSMCLVQMMQTLDLRISIAHVNYGLRGEESDGDAQFVRDYASKNRLVCHVLSVDCKEKARQSGQSIQEAARRIRFDWFDQLVSEYNYDRVALGHHIDDSIETVLINQVRGTGIRGLLGIQVKRGIYIRPLLCLYRENIREYVVDNALEYREDSSNTTDDYLRNAIRHRIIPVLQELRKGFKGVILGNAERIGHTMESLGRLTDWFAHRVIEQRKDGCDILREELLRTPDPQYILEHIARNYGFNSDQAHGILTSTKDSGALAESSTHQMFIDRDWISIRSRVSVPPVDTAFMIGENVESGIGTLTSAFCPPPERFDTSRLIEYFDADKVPGPYTLRTWKPGDRIATLGTGGTQKVSDILTNEKVSFAERGSQLVVAFGETIVWLIGHRISSDTLIDHKTQNCIKLEWIPD